MALYPTTNMPTAQAPAPVTAPMPDTTRRYVPAGAQGGTVPQRVYAALIRPPVSTANWTPQLLPAIADRSGPQGALPASVTHAPGFKAPEFLPLVQQVIVGAGNYIPPVTLPPNLQVTIPGLLPPFALLPAEPDATLPGGPLTAYVAQNPGFQAPEVLPPAQVVVQGAGNAVLTAYVVHAAPYKAPEQLPINEQPIAGANPAVVVPSAPVQVTIPGLLPPIALLPSLPDTDVLGGPLTAYVARNPGFKAPESLPIVQRTIAGAGNVALTAYVVHAPPFKAPEQLPAVEQPIAGANPPYVPPTSGTTTQATDPRPVWTSTSASTRPGAGTLAGVAFVTFSQDPRAPASLPQIDAVVAPGVPAAPSSTTSQAAAALLAVLPPLTSAIPGAGQPPGVGSRVLPTDPRAPVLGPPIESLLPGVPPPPPPTSGPTVQAPPSTLALLPPLDALEPGAGMPPGVAGRALAADPRPAVPSTVATLAAGAGAPPGVAALVSPPDPRAAALLPPVPVVAVGFGTLPGVPFVVVEADPRGPYLLPPSTAISVGSTNPPPGVAALAQAVDARAAYLAAPVDWLQAGVAFPVTQAAAQAFALDPRSPVAAAVPALQAGAGSPAQVPSRAFAFDVRAPYPSTVATLILGAGVAPSVAELVAAFDPRSPVVSGSFWLQAGGGSPVQAAAQLSAAVAPGPVASVAFWLQPGSGTLPGTAFLAVAPDARVPAVLPPSSATTQGVPPPLPPGTPARNVQGLIVPAVALPPQPFTHGLPPGFVFTVTISQRVGGLLQHATVTVAVPGGGGSVWPGSLLGFPVYHRPGRLERRPPMEWERERDAALERKRAKSDELSRKLVRLAKARLQAIEEGFASVLALPPVYYGIETRHRLGGFRQAASVAHDPPRFAATSRQAVGVFGQAATLVRTYDLRTTQRIGGLEQAAEGSHARVACVAQALGGFGQRASAASSRSAVVRQAMPAFAQDSDKIAPIHLKAPPTAEEQYVIEVQRILAVVHAAALRIVDRDLKPEDVREKQDASIRDVKKKLAGVTGQFAGWIKQKVASAFDRMSTAVEIRTGQGAAILGIHRMEVPGLASVIEEARAENVSLITNASEDFLNQILDVLDEFEDLPAGPGAGASRLGKLLNPEEGEEAPAFRSIAEALQARVGVSKSRATLIARDQTLKLNGKVIRHRQVAAGVNKFRWSTSQDERVRETHREVNGKVFSWDDDARAEEMADYDISDDDPDDPAPTPGDPIQCRCVPIPIIPELDEEGEEEGEGEEGEEEVGEVPAEEGEADDEG